MWRNWNTRTFQERMPQGLRVRVPPSPQLVENKHEESKSKLNGAGRTGFRPPPAEAGYGLRRQESAAARSWEFKSPPGHTRKINQLTNFLFTAHCKLFTNSFALLIKIRVIRDYSITNHHDQKITSIPAPRPIRPCIGKHQY